MRLGEEKRKKERKKEETTGQKYKWSALFHRATIIRNQQLKNSVTDILNVTVCKQVISYSKIEPGLNVVLAK